MQNFLVRYYGKFYLKCQLFLGMITNDSRGLLAGKRNISERPASVETRKYKGHWEI